MGNSQSNQTIENLQSTFSLKSKNNMDNKKIDLALIELLKSAIQLIEQRTDESDTSLNSDNESESGSNCESDGSMPGLISESDTIRDEITSSSESDLE